MNLCQRLAHSLALGGVGFFNVLTFQLVHQHCGLAAENGHQHAIQGALRCRYRETVVAEVSCQLIKKGNIVKTEVLNNSQHEILIFTVLGCRDKVVRIFYPAFNGTELFQLAHAKHDQVAFQRRGLKRCEGAHLPLQNHPFRIQFFLVIKRLEVSAAVCGNHVVRQPEAIFWHDFDHDQDAVLPVLVDSAVFAFNDLDWIFVFRNGRGETS